MPDPAPSCSCTAASNGTCRNQPVGADGLCDYCRRNPSCRQYRGES